MDYSNIIVLDYITVQDCINMYMIKGMYAVLNDGRLVTFEKEED